MRFQSSSDPVVQGVAQSCRFRMRNRRITGSALVDLDRWLRILHIVGTVSCMPDAALTTLSAESRSTRATARQLAAQVDDGSELGHALRAVLEDVASGRSVVILRPTEEVTPATAAKVLGVTRQFVDRLCAEGVLPFRRLPSSSHRKILLSDVLALAAERDRRREGAAAIRSVLDESS